MADQPGTSTSSPSKRKSSVEDREESLLKYLLIRKEIDECDLKLKRLHLKKRKMEASDPFIGTIKGMLKDRDSAASGGFGPIPQASPAKEPKSKKPKRPKGIGEDQVRELTPEERLKYRMKKDIENRANMLVKAGKPPTEKLRKSLKKAQDSGVDNLDPAMVVWIQTGVNLGNPTSYQVLGVGGPGMSYVPVPMESSGGLDVRGTGLHYGDSINDPQPTQSI